MDPTSFIPDSLKQRVFNSLVEFVARQAENLNQREIAERIRVLSTEAQFHDALDKALEQGFQRFVNEYTEQDEDLVAALVGDQSLWQAEEVQQALIELVSRPGAWLNEQQELLAQHFSSVLPDRVNRQRVDRAITHLLRCMAEELWTLPGASEVREVYGLQFQRLTAEATREQVAIARQQLAATTQLTTDLRQTLLQLTGAIEKNLLMSPAEPLLLQTPFPYHNLPQPTYLRLVGREQELAWLRERLLPADRAWQIAIMGIGVVGKTALAAAIAQEYVQNYANLPPEQRFDAIIWISAKEEVLTVQGRAPASLPGQVLHTLEDIYRIIAQVLEREEITSVALDKQDHVVQKALRRQRTLLIVDNLESVKDERVTVFLYNLPEPTKAIITTRDRIATPATWTLMGLSWEDTRALLDEEGTVRGVRLTIEQCRRIFELTQGLPLPIKLAVARLAGEESFDAVTRWLGDATGDIPEYCIAGQIELARARNQIAWNIIVACSLFDREAGASATCIGFVVDVSRFDLDRALADLLRLFLINRGDNERYWALPIVQRYVESSLAGDASISWIVDRWLEWLMGIAQNYGGQYDYDITSRQVISLEYSNLRIGILWCRDRQLWPQLEVLCRGTWLCTYRFSLYNDLDEILGLWLLAADKQANSLAQGRACLQLGRLAWIRRSRDMASDYLGRAEPILREHKAYLELIELLATQYEILHFHGHDVQETQLAQTMVELSELTDNLDAKIHAAYKMADSLYRKGDYDSAATWLDKIDEWARTFSVPYRTAMVAYRRGVNLIGEGRFKEAEPFLTLAEAINRDLGERRYVAYDLFRLVQVYGATGRIQAARDAGKEAMDLFERMGLLSEANEIQRKLNSLPQTTT